MRISDFSPASDRQRARRAALGEEPCDLRIVHCRLVNVLTGEIYPAEVDLCEQWIVACRQAGEAPGPEARRTLDAQGAYLIPGFIDTHVHIESSMMTPANFAQVAVGWGTTTVITDPHEITNVMGEAGVSFMAADAKRALLRQFILVPSCVPSNPQLETGGTVLTPEQIAGLLTRPEVLGLGEVMDYDGVCRGEQRMTDELTAALRQNLFLQGHAPRLTGAPLNAYLVSGIQSDHECRSGDEALRKLRSGMHINLKSSSLSNHLFDALQGLQDVRWRDNVSFCTDDVHAQTIVSEGHLNRIVAEAIGYGLDPVEAIRMASLHAAREYGFCDLGAIAPGYVADLQLVPALDGSRPTHVFIGGKLTAENGRCPAPTDAQPQKPPMGKTVDLAQLHSEESLRLAAEPDAQVLTLQFKTLHDNFHSACYEQPHEKEGVIDVTADAELALLCVCNRHGRGGKTIVPIRGTGLRAGAFATTVSHDCHNLLIVYRSEADAWLAAQTLERLGGGFAAVLDGKVLGTLALPVGGLMSPLDGRTLADEISAFERASAEILPSGRPGDNLLRFATSALPVLPGFVVTDKGVVDGRKQCLVPAFRK